MSVESAEVPSVSELCTEIVGACREAIHARECGDVVEAELAEVRMNQFLDQLPVRARPRRRVRSWE